MPWHWEPKKDVVNCEKATGSRGQTLIRADVRMEQSAWS